MNKPKFTKEEWIGQPCESICSDYEVTTKEREEVGLSPIFSIDILDDDLSVEQNANLSLLMNAKNMYEMIEELTSELHQAIDEVNDQRLSRVNSQTETPPDLWDGQTLHEAQQLLKSVRGE